MFTVHKEPWCKQSVSVGHDDAVKFSHALWMLIERGYSLIPDEERADLERLGDLLDSIHEESKR